MHVKRPAPKFFLRCGPLAFLSSKKCRNHRRNKKRRKQKLAATSKSWLVDLLKDIAEGVATTLSIKMLKLD